MKAATATATTTSPNKTPSPDKDLAYAYNNPNIAPTTPVPLFNQSQQYQHSRSFSGNSINGYPGQHSRSGSVSSNYQQQQQPPLQPPPPTARRTPRPMSSRSSLSSFDFTANNNNNNDRNSTASPSINELASQFASASMFDLSQSYLTPHLGQNSSSLMPRIKTIELYRKNAKKSNDPVIQFQFAQYMLQTALLSGTNSTTNPNTNTNNNSSSDSSFTSSQFDTNNNNSNPGITKSTSSPSLPLDSPTKRQHRLSTMSANSQQQMSAEDEKKIKSDLLKEAISNLRKLADRGFADAQYLLGDAYASGALGKPDLKESFSLFQLAAKHGHAEASYRAALCLEEGWGTSKDVRRAVQFLRNAASRNQPGAMLRLGLACFYGKLGLGNSVNVKQEGIKWLTRAAESANEVFPQAPFELAKIYEVGYRDIVFKDLQYSVQLYVKSAEFHYIPAASKLGHAYEYGTLNCPQDAALSIHYYTLAALGGDPSSMLAMCAWYMVGAEPVLPRNEEEAYEWAHRAAECGLAKAQFAVGYFLENGIGSERNILESSNWYRKAAAGGDERAIERLKKNREGTNTNNGKKSSKSESKKDKDCVIC